MNFSLTYEFIMLNSNRPFLHELKKNLNFFETVNKR